MPISSQVIEEGPKNLVMKFLNTSDATAETNVVKVPISALSGFDSMLPRTVRIEKIHYSLKACNVQIIWDGTPDVIAWELTPDTDNTIDFTDAPLTNNAVAGRDVLFTTVDVGTGSSYSIVLYMAKVY